MTMHVFENWTPESVPCPRCQALLTAPGAVCWRCGPGSQDAAAQPPTVQPIEIDAAAPEHPAPPAAAPTYLPPTGPPSYVPAAYVPAAPEALVPTTPAPMASLPYALVRPAKRGPRLGAVVALIALLGVLTGAAYGIRALAGRSRSTHDGVGLPTPSSSAPAPDPQLGTGPLSLAAIPIRADELPGWQVMPPDPDTEDQAADAGMNRCLGQRANASAPIVEQSETDYQLGPYSISSQAERMPSQAAVKADLAPIHDPKLKTCVQRWFRRDFAHAAPGAHLTSLNVEIVPGSHGGPASIAGTMSIQCLITVNGATRTVFLTTTVITGRRIESQVTFTGVNAPVDAGLQQRLVTAVALRTAQA